METITISTTEYKELIFKAAAVDAFARYVNSSKYAIDQEVCAAILGFEVGNDSDKH